MYEPAAIADGLAGVNVSPVPNNVPPVGVSYQFTVSAAQVAPNSYSVKSVEPSQATVLSVVLVISPGVLTFTVTWSAGDEHPSTSTVTS